MITPDVSLAAASLTIVKEAVPAEKVRLAKLAAKSWKEGSIAAFSSSEKLIFPPHPGRPDKPELLDPRQMPRRRIGSKKGLIALVHALVHIELNAIDLSFDFIARFAEAPLPRTFLDGAVKVALDEACHFEMINACLERLGGKYGDLPAHGGLWSAASDTSHDLLARLAIVPLVLEARGLDVSPKMIAQVEATGDKTTAQTMQTIYQDEITHVAFGAKWFKFICQQQGTSPQKNFQSLVKKYFRGTLRPPFNEKARTLAGLSPDFYTQLDKN